MNTAEAFLQVSLENDLGYEVTVYDSYSEQDNQNYFGTLTPLSTVAAKATSSVELIHETSVLIVSNTATQDPLARLIVSPLFPKKAFTVSQADEEAMTQTMQFIDFITHNPNDALATSFQAIWKNTTGSPVKPVNSFFAAQPTYAKCTFQTYMMGITTAAKKVENTPKPLEQATYSLSTLVRLLGGTWPTDFPDITVTKFTCDTQNGSLDIFVEIDLNNLPAESSQILRNFSSLFIARKLQVRVELHHGFDLGFLGTRLSILRDTISIPLGGTATLDITKPTISIDINPIFKFVVFTIEGTIPFNVFGKKFDADISMTIDNLEASVGAVIRGDYASLPVPSIMRGVHFDEFGVGIGVFFEPPGGIIGVQGKLHIAKPNGQHLVQLDDDTFVVVCQMVGEVPNPVFVSFYVPKLDLNQAVEIFTDSKIDLHVPVSFTDLSFKWSENPMEPFVLPDGTLSSMGYGFSGAVNILSFGFYGDVNIDLRGITADLSMSPLVWHDVFRLTGDGPGVKIKVDQNGSPIKNNQIPNQAQLDHLLNTATTEELVSPGGPVLKIQTLASPILHLNGKVSLFELVNYGIEADINEDGIHFFLDFGGVLTKRMECTLSHFHNLSASFQFGINRNFSLPRIAGVSLGAIGVHTTANAHLTIVTLSDVVMSVGGGFDFQGLHRSFGDFTADVHIKKVTDLLEAVFHNIEQDAARIFSDLVGVAEEWANRAKQGIITIVDSIPEVLKNAYSKSSAETATIMKDVGFNPTEVASALRNTFGMGANEVASTLKNTFNLGANDVAYAMQQVGYGAQEVGTALKNIFSLNEVTGALKTVYGMGASDLNNVLKQIGYASNDIANAFKSFGGDLADFGSKVADKLNPTHW